MLIQANFNETDLRNVQAGNRVTIFHEFIFGEKYIMELFFQKIGLCQVVK